MDSFLSQSQKANTCPHQTGMDQNQSKRILVPTIEISPAPRPTLMRSLSRPILAENRRPVLPGRSFSETPLLVADVEAGEKHSIESSLPDYSSASAQTLSGKPQSAASVTVRPLFYHSDTISRCSTSSQKQHASFSSRVKSHFEKRVVTTRVWPVLIVLSFLTGLINASALLTWGTFPGSQTGNTIQLGVGTTNIATVTTLTKINDQLPLVAKRHIAAPEYEYYFTDSVQLSPETVAELEQGHATLYSTPSLRSYPLVKAGFAVFGYALGSFLLSRLARSKRFFAYGETSRSSLLVNLAVQAILILIPAILMSKLNLPLTLDTSTTTFHADNSTLIQCIPIFMLEFQAAGQFYLSRAIKYNEAPTIFVAGVYGDLFSDPNLFKRDNQKRNNRALSILSMFLGGVAGAWVATTPGRMGAALFFAAGLKALCAASVAFWPVQSDETTLTREKV